jgi:hypothetical protein
VIYESYFWKRDLLRYAEVLRKKTTQRRWVEASGALVEKTVFIGFYAIRKLLEAKKVSTSLHSRNIRCRVCKPTGKPVTILNRHRLDELFDLSSWKPSHIPVTSLANQVIHSYVFAMAHSESHRWESILVTSDREKVRRLYEISATELIKTFEVFGNNYPSKGKWEFDESINDYRVENS